MAGLYEDETDEDYWLDEAREQGETFGVDTREGSVYMDTQSGHCFRIAKFYTDLNSVVDMLAVDTCTGAILTEKAAMDGVNRYESSPSRWSAVFEGTVPEYGTEFMCGDYYFLWTDVNGMGYLVSENAGVETNNLISGTELIPMDTISGLESAVLGELLIEGEDEESDDALRERWIAQKTAPAENGNRPQYKIWCEQVGGIGRAKIYPLWGGPLTVMAVLFGSSGGVVSDELVKNVQDYIDPIQKGYPVEMNGIEYIFGDGLGEGTAGIGAHFLAMSASPMELTISADITLEDGYNLETVVDDAVEQIKNYLSILTLKSADDAAVIVRISSIGALISKIDGVIDYEYDSLIINGETSNIYVDDTAVAVLSEVIFNNVGT